MADSRPVDAELRAELSAARDVLAPQIRGLQDIVKTSISIPTSVVVAGALGRQVHRDALLRSVIDGIDALNNALAALMADGYPAVNQFTVLPDVFSDLGEEGGDLEAALGLFQTVNMVISLGMPQDKS